MGRSFYDVPAAALPNGGGYVTSESARLQASSVVSLTAIEGAARSLELAVSGAITAVVTGIMGAPAVTTLSASYSSLSASIY